MPIGPSQELENTFRILNTSFNYTRIPYWLSFGGLWSLIMNNGIIPDHDLDVQTYYGQDWKKLRRVLEGRGYIMTRAMQNDVDPDNILYMAFNHPKWLHLCITFVYPSYGIRWYCHDNHFTVTGVGIPTIGYFFKGYPEDLVEGDEKFFMAEWPGITQEVKIRVPRFPGGILDHLYPAWAYRKQRYNVEKHKVQPDKMKSIHKGGAISPYMVHLDSMGDFKNESKFRGKFEEGKRNFKIHLKNIRK